MALPSLYHRPVEECLPCRKHTIFGIFIVALSLLVSILLSECLLRIAGFGPWRHYTIDRNEPVMYQHNPVLGWENKPGRYTYPAYVGTGQNITVTFLHDGSRATSDDRNRSANLTSVIMSGCSFTQGWAVSDNETFSWKLQEAFPQLQFINYGTGGYSTYQSLLRLEKVLPRMKPTMVVFGLILKQEERNVAGADWLRHLTRYSRRGHVDVPYVIIGPNGRLLRHAPESYPSFAFREASALITFAEWWYARLHHNRQLDRRREITEKLLLEMDGLVRQYRGQFLVAILDGTEGKRQAYGAFLENHGVKYVDCSHPMPNEMRVTGEGHPNGKMHSLWANCIGQELPKFLALSESAVVPKRTRQGWPRPDDQ